MPGVTLRRQTRDRHPAARVASRPPHCAPVDSFEKRVVGGLGIIALGDVIMVGSMRGLGTALTCLSLFAAVGEAYRAAASSFPDPRANPFPAQDKPPSANARKG